MTCLDPPTINSDQVGLFESELNSALVMLTERKPGLFLTLCRLITLYPKDCERLLSESRDGWNPPYGPLAQCISRMKSSIL